MKALDTKLTDETREGLNKFLIEATENTKNMGEYIMTLTEMSLTFLMSLAFAEGTSNNLEVAKKLAHAFVDTAAEQHEDLTTERIIDEIKNRSQTKKVTLKATKFKS